MSSTHPESERGLAVLALARAYGVPKAEIDDIYADLQKSVEAYQISVEMVLSLWAAREMVKLARTATVEIHGEGDLKKMAGVPVPTAPPANNTALGRMVGVERKEKP